MNNLINQFNKKDTHLVISGYPEKDGQGNHYGMSWYTKSTIEPLARKKNARFVVLAETNGNNEPKIYKDGRILVLRVFDQRRLSLYPRILKWLAKFNHIDKVYVHSEFGANGGVKNFVFLLPFLLLIKLTGRKVIFFAHNFVSDFNSVAVHLNLDKIPFLLLFLNQLIKIYNFFLGLITDKVVVMDEVLYRRAAKYILKDKIISVPMFVKKPGKMISKTRARQKLGIKESELVLLYFGFMTHYKGVDWLINQVRKIKKINNKKLRLIIAGGKAYSLKDKKHYQNFFSLQKRKIKTSGNILQTGFLEEKDIGQYFAAADLAVFPYRGLIGSSGSLSYALSYKKPFVISSLMSGILTNWDMARALEKVQLPAKHLVFDLNQESFKEKLKQMSNPLFVKKMTSFSQKLRQARDYHANLDSYYKKIYAIKGRGFINSIAGIYETIFSKLAVS